MLREIMQVVSIAALLLAAILWSNAPSAHLLRFVVGLTAISLTVLKSRPLLSIPSIADHPRGEAR